MAGGYTTHLLGSAQDLGDGRFGVLVEYGDTTFYVEHQVVTEGLRASVWDEHGHDLKVERRMDWAEVVERMFTTWQEGVEPAPQ